MPMMSGEWAAFVPFCTTGSMGVGTPDGPARRGCSMFLTMNLVSAVLSAGTSVPSGGETTGAAGTLTASARAAGRQSSDRTTNAAADLTERMEPLPLVLSVAGD